MNMKELLRESYLAGFAYGAAHGGYFRPLRRTPTIKDATGAFNRWLKDTEYRHYYAWVLQLAERHKHEKPQGGNDV